MKSATSFIITKIKPGFTLFRLIGLLIGLLLYFAINPYTGLSLMVISAIYSLTSTGKEINTSKKSIRDFRKLGKLTYGKWIDLPPIKYIAVVRMLRGKKSFHASSVSIVQMATDEYVYVLNLVVDPVKNDTIKLLEGSLNESISSALKLGEMLNLKVLDFTTPDHKWIR